MSGQKERYGAEVILRKKIWSMEDALHALDAEFWCRNEANDPENFIPGVCTILVGDPGHKFWLELRAKIRLYFQAAAASPGSQGKRHPMTSKTIKKALAAVRAFYGNQYVIINGERVQWKLALPDRADWIVDRFCSPFQGWNPILSNAASILGLFKWLDVLEPVDEARTSTEGGNVSMQGNDEDDLSEDDSSIKDEDTPVKNDDALSSLKTEIENQQRQIGQQRDEFNQPQSKAEHLKEEGGTQQTGLEGLKGDYLRLEEKLDEQAKEMEQLRSTIVGLTAKLDKLQTHTDGQEELHKKHLDEVLNLSSMLTTSMKEIKNLKSSNLHQSPAGVTPVATTSDEAIESVEDVFNNGSKPSTTLSNHDKTEISASESQDLPADTASDVSLSESAIFSRLATPDAGPSSALGGRRVSLKRKVSETSTPETPTRKGRTFSVVNTPTSFTPVNGDRNPFDSHVHAPTDPRRPRARGSRQAIRRGDLDDYVLPPLPSIREVDDTVSMYDDARRRQKKEKRKKNRIAPDEETREFDLHSDNEEVEESSPRSGNELPESDSEDYRWNSPTMDGDMRQCELNRKAAKKELKNWYIS
ncbi:hypothetical protein FOQG_07362 [Fusarium oxysporum f. sp. raphani 54005]|uniref:Uncharacterized protein n=2 Tax=Fusarium oxysporum f. sp. raphani TaxID=96318 RepID=X0D5F2_FUSOX|nr:hypothetical protein FOQG_07362 [Fusarium oxysporum f. sp. raphani 54005]KAG7437190.1 hypothetical protein Forpi1262_v001188 [Fusarium oxysporum f. sp. raphani]WKT39022.1 hypothetical protein QSH57_000841 [Fusarium oxysporum f. sp. vasinfectum]